MARTDSTECLRRQTWSWRLGYRGVLFWLAISLPYLTRPGEVRGQLPNPVSVYWDIGHGVEDDYEPSGRYAELIDHLGPSFRVTAGTAPLDSVDLVTQDILILAAGSCAYSFFTPDELDAVEDYVHAGGSLLLLSDLPGGSGTPKINQVARRFGAEVGVSSLPGNQLRSTWIADHPVVAGVEEITVVVGGAFYPGDLTVQIESRGYPLLASGLRGLGKLVIIADGDLFTTFGSFPFPIRYFDLSDNRQLATSVFSYIATPCAEEEAGGVDVDANGIPDACEPDCDSDGIPDSAAIADGIATDCTGTGRPDSCDIQSGSARDCNRNGIPDDCDLAAGTSQDCDHDGLLDDCHLAFSASTRIPAGDGPQSLVAADLDGDGLTDLISASSNVNDIVVHRATLSGSFLPGRSFLVGEGPQALVVGDLDGDEIPDLASANLRSEDLSVLRGRGDGSFSTLATLPVPGRVRSLAIADLDSDGNQDLVACSSSPIRITVYMNDPAGVFDSPLDIGLTDNPIAVLAVDIDGDGAVDLIAATDGSIRPPGGLLILYGHGNGDFEDPVSWPAGDIPSAVATSDIDSDGFTDLVATDISSDHVYVLLGGPSRSFGTAMNYPTGAVPQSLALQDIDEDGQIDIVTANRSGSLSILRGLGNGEFSPTENYVSGAESVAVVPLVQEELKVPRSRVGLAVANVREDSIMIIPVNSFGRVGSPRQFAAGDDPRDIIAADFDEDGIIDLVAANRGTSDLALLRAKTDGTFRPGEVLTTWRSQEDLVVADLNGDHHLDIAVSSRDQEAVGILLGRGDGRFGPAVAYPAGLNPKSISPADLDSDGVLDLITFNTGGSSVAILPGSGDGTFGDPIHFDLGDDLVALVVDDLDADGRTDLIFLDFASEELLVLTSQSGFEFEIVARYALSGPAGYMAGGDFDGDGLTDVAVLGRKTYRATVTVLLGIGDLRFSEPLFVPLRFASSTLIADDLDSDGVLDLATFYQQENDIAVLLGRGDGAFLPPMTFPVGWPPLGLAVTDLTGDGSRDLVTITGANSLAVMANSFQDCDASGGLDACEIRDAVLFDCDDNDVPDVCDIAADPTLDLDADGQLDLCVPPSLVRRGDSNDDTQIDISDPIYTLRVVFLGEGDIACADAADFNDDGSITLDDAVFTVEWIFLGLVVAPAPALQACWPDLTQDELERCSSSACAL